MSKIDKLPSFTVKVDGGSGCLFQPIDDAYSYVLTAKHVLNGNSKPTIIRPTYNEIGEVINELLEIIDVPFKHKDPNKDAAIIKVKKVEDIIELIREDEVSDNGNNYWLIGHPKSRRSKNDSFRGDIIRILYEGEYKYYEAQSSNSIIYQEVVGQSGGGIIKVEESCFLLKGIQSRMAAEDGKETLGRIQFMPLSFFDEIIDENNQSLSPLFPPYIGSFEKLLHDIFPLPNLIIKRDLIQNELKKIANGLCNDFSPKTILELFGDQFLIHGTEKVIINHPQLWISFLEILSINQLHNTNKLTLIDLKELHKKRKLFIVDTDKWTKKIEDIYKSNLSDIENGGSIVICATNEKEPTKVEILPEELIILDISTPFEEGNISNTVKNPFKEMRLINIFKFQSHIINNAIHYREMTLMNSQEILKDTTNGII